MHLEGHLALVAHALEGERLRAAGTPAAVGAADEERAVLLVHADRDKAGLEALQEVEDRALVEAVDDLEVDALDLRSGLLADEELVGPGTPLALGHVARDARGRVADLAVGQDHRRRDEVGELEALGQHARAALGFGRGREAEERGGLIAGRVALEGTGAQPLEGGGAVPHALVVGVEDVTLVVHADAARGADAGGGRDHLALGGDAHAPAAPRRVGVEGAGQAEHDPDVAVLIGIGAEGVLMVVAVDAPLRADRVEGVGLAVAVGVGQAGVLRTLGEEERLILVEHAERLVQVGGELGPLDLGDVVLVGAFADPDVAAAGRDGDLLAGHQGDRGDLDDLAGRGRDLDAVVVLRLQREGLGARDLGGLLLGLGAGERR